MKCHDFLGGLHPYLDDELPVLRTLRMHGHVLWCNPCRRVMQAEAALTSLLAADALEDSAPAGLRERILDQIRTEPSPAPRSRASAWQFSVLSAWLVGAVLVGLLLVSIWLMPGPSKPVPPVVADVVAEHLQYSDGRDVALEMTTSDSARMASWFEQRLGLQMELPRLDGPDERLIGGRVSQSADGPAAYLLYEWRGRPVSLIVAKSGPPDRSGTSAEVIDGVELRTAVLHDVALVWWWEENEGRVYAAASRGDHQALVEFAQRCIEKHPATPEKPRT
jgi:anti-sigma factor RsiW